MNEHSKIITAGKVYKWFAQIIRSKLIDYNVKSNNKKLSDKS
jgi:hypothetical protein